MGVFISNTLTYEKKQKVSFIKRFYLVSLYFSGWYKLYRGWWTNIAGSNNTTFNRKLSIFNPAPSSYGLTVRIWIFPLCAKVVPFLPTKTYHFWQKFYKFWKVQVSNKLIYGSLKYPRKIRSFTILSGEFHGVFVEWSKPEVFDTDSGITNTGLP